MSVFCQSDRVSLRRASPDDAATIARWKADPLVVRMALGAGHATDGAQERADLERASAADDELYLLIVARDDGGPVGYLRVNWMDEARRRAWLRFSMGERRREGFMRDALITLLRRLFEEGLHRADAEAYEFNEASLALLDGLGFVREGRKRKACRDGGVWRDIVAFGLLREDLSE